MKFLHILTLLLVALVAHTSAQRCNDRNSNCVGPRNVGRSDLRCISSTRWHYDARSRQCRPMRYLGCGGNRNNWCTRVACERRCRR